jgi:hypothetical protein
MRVVRLISVCVVGAIFLAACGSSSSGTSSGGTTPTKQQIRPMLLALSDMPTGWATAPNSKDDSSSTELCSAQLGDSLGGTKAPSAQVTFQSATASLVPTQLIEEVAYVPSASAKFNRVASILNSCHSTSEGSGSQKLTLNIGRMSFPSLGDQSGAWLMSGSVSIVSISAPIVIVRKGDYLALLLLVGTGSNSASTLEGIAKTAVGKVA